MERGPIPTLGELQRATPWVWLWCERCQHHAPLACAVAVIRWGADMSSDRLRQRARGSSCGKKGATIQHPGWGGNDVGFLPFRNTPYKKRDRRAFGQSRQASSPSGRLTKTNAASIVPAMRKAASCAFQSFDCHMAKYSPPITTKPKNHRQKPSVNPATAQSFARLKILALARNRLSRTTAPSASKRPVETSVAMINA